MDDGAMRFERKNLMMLMVVAIVIGAMNGLFGISALLSLSEHCPGDACGDATTMTVMGLVIMTICLGTAIWAGLRVRRGG